MKRLLIALLLVLPALAATSTRVAAAGIPMPTHPIRTAQSSDYFFEMESCTNGATEICGYELAYSNSTSPVAHPDGGYFGCETYTSTTESYIELDYGSYGSGSVGGVAGVTSTASNAGTVYSDLSGHGITSYDQYSGPVSGSAIGLVKYGPASYFPDFLGVITTGKVTITLQGTIETYNYTTDSYSVSQGKMTCAISASSYFSYVYGGAVD
jgi:hypothetical protein